MSDNTDWTDNDRFGAFRLLVRMLRRQSPDPNKFSVGLSEMMAEEMYDALEGDAARGASMILAVGARRRARPPSASA